MYAKRAMEDEKRLMPALHEAYGAALQDVRIISFHSKYHRADNLRIALLALEHLGETKADAVLSRNLYAAYVIAVLQRKPLLFETHQLEHGLRKILQKQIMTRPWVTTIAISNRLVECLTAHHGVAPHREMVLHDAAPEGNVPLSGDEKKSAVERFAGKAVGAWSAICGYFGHLYPGRGIEIIQGMAARRPDVLFLIFGGNDEDIRRLADRLSLDNLRCMGHVPHTVAREAMSAVDVLLMPYQRSVSISIAGQDTAQWMSPMKMFEYMGSGVPIISSNLPVLREVLRNDENCLLVEPDRLNDWLDALDKLEKTPALAERLGRTAREAYETKYTWAHRASGILRAAADL
jgi:hypothetical protein